MKTFQSRVNVSSEDYRQNRDSMMVLMGDLRKHLADSQWQGDARHTTRWAEERFQREGRLLARERVELLLDEDSPFLEICPLSGLGQGDYNTGGTVVGGIGLVCGVACVVLANVPTINGGTINPPSMMRSGRLGQIAIANRLPMIRLTESGGADLRVQAEVFHTGGGGFYHQAHMSKAGVPQISVVFGNSTAGGAYGPGMSDYTIMVKNRGLMFLGGPPLVKMATGEEADEEQLGGGDMHSRVSGVSDYLAVSELDALRKTREVVATLNFRPLFADRHLRPPVQEPLYSADELLGIVGANLKKPFDMREVVARIVDGSQWSEFKPLFGQSIFTAWARINGYLIGIIANRDGVIFSEAALKATQFIYLCNQKSCPILFLHNVTGFMVGTKYEQGGIIKHGSQMINAVSNSGVPHLSVIVGSSYGAGNYAMCGRMYQPRFLWSWPNSRCAVMGGDQLAGVLDIVERRSAAKRGVTIDESQAKARLEMFSKMVDTTADVFYTSSRCLDDSVIDPRDMRIVLSLCLDIIHTQPVKGDNTFGISRL